MSFEPGSPIADNPIAHLDPPKSGKKKFLIGGCGCLGVLALLCVGGSAFIWIQFGKPMMDFMNENTTFVASSEVAKEALGDPITVGPPTKTEPQGQSVTMEFPVSGSKGSGIMVLRGSLKDGKWVRDEIYLEVDGNRIELSPDSEFQLDVNDGSQ